MLVSRLVGQSACTLHYLGAAACCYCCCKICLCIDGMKRAGKCGYITKCHSNNYKRTTQIRYILISRALSRKKKKTKSEREIEIDGTGRPSPSLGVRSTTCPSQRLGYPAPCVPCIIVVLSHCLHLGPKWLRKMFPQTGFSLAFDLHHTHPTVSCTARTRHQSNTWAHLSSDRASNMHEWASKVQLYDSPPCNFFVLV